MIDPTERERPSLGLLLEKMPEVISVPRSNKRVELNIRNGNDMLVTILRTFRMLLRPSWCPHPHASLIEEITERVRLSLAKDEDLGNLNVVHKLTLPQRKESEETTSKLDKLVKKIEPGIFFWTWCVEVESIPVTDDPASEYNFFRKRN